MRLIEITGIPGCGKSTISPLVKSYLAKSGIEAFNSPSVILMSKSLAANKLHLKRAIEYIYAQLSDKTLRKLIRKLNLKQKYRDRYIASNPQLYSYVQCLTNSRPIPSSHKKQIIRFFLNSGAIYQIASERISKDATFIFDEGFVHRVVTLFVSVEETKVDFKELDRYLNRIPPVHLLIKVEADEDVCKNRMVNGKLPFRLGGKKEREILDFLSKSNLVIDYAVNYLIQSGARAITIDNRNEPFFENHINSQLEARLKILQTSKIIS